MEVLHPDNKIKYNEGDRVQIALGGDVNNIVTGIVCGISSEHVIDFWIIKLDHFIDGWQYSCVTFQHTFIRPIGDNRPFLCEGVSRG